MDVDTGATVSVISSAKQARLFPKTVLKSTSTVLTTYTGEPMAVAGIMDVDVSYQGQREVLRLYVVQGDGPTLFGREWLRAIRLDWANIGLTSIANSQRRVEALLEKYAEDLVCFCCNCCLLYNIL
jgi:hypothetical protein